MSIVEDFQVEIKTVDRDRKVFVDRYEDNEVWLSIMFRGGTAGCVLDLEQARRMIAALQRVIDEA